AVASSSWLRWNSGQARAWCRSAIAATTASTAGVTSPVSGSTRRNSSSTPTVRAATSIDLPVPRGRETREDRMVRPPGPFVEWIAQPPAAGGGAHDGPLRGLRLAVKDLVDVAGLPTGAGHPRWLATHPVPERSA